MIGINIFEKETIYSYTRSPDSLNNTGDWRFVKDPVWNGVYIHDGVKDSIESFIWKQDTSNIDTYDLIYLITYKNILIHILLIDSFIWYIVTKTKTIEIIK